MRASFFLRALLSDGFVDSVAASVAFPKELSHSSFHKLHFELEMLIEGNQCLLRYPGKGRLGDFNGHSCVDFLCGLAFPR